MMRHPTVYAARRHEIRGWAPEYLCDFYIQTASGQQLYFQTYTESDARGRPVGEAIEERRVQIENLLATYFQELTADVG
jgi:hypothetical protein